MAWDWMLIEVCDANPADCPELFALEQEFPGLSVLETACMSHCDLCASSPYVLLDGEMVTAPDTTALFDKVREELARRMADQRSEI
ncbi:DUF1450 domain-containing protein [Alicyclobacillus macrosporangiidus]|uniref:DUF1450 domain-containing protein n=1 Tax=Alicyclobacillus macrosporangiidus TaxID=392015 RepID=A0A1I7KLZ4_9BACL|nr:DUF1450 domain-containing protein [Alicyclobacillus macrosporangiidus]SFU98374.1 Protein of unknown function [Alicyclobacillus macrosporangiidus]